MYGLTKILETGFVSLVGEAYEIMTDATVGIVSEPNQLVGESRTSLLERAFRYTVESAKAYEMEGSLLHLIEICAKQRQLASLLKDEQRIIKIDEITKGLRERLTINATAAYCPR
jgi:hypothetical protein